MQVLKEAIILFGGPFVLNVDPVFARLWGVPLSYHGLSYAIGFLLIYLWMMLRRIYIGLPSGKVVNLAIIISVLGLLFGRSFYVFISQQSLYYGRYLEMAFFWHKGMAITGVIAGIFAAILIFRVIYKKKILLIADEVVIPLCLTLVLIRIANHLSGELYGSLTNVWWAVKFPLADGFRHPVALCEAGKNLVIFFILLSITSNFNPGQGKTTGNFIFWSGLGSFFINYFGVSHSFFPKPGTGQFLNCLFIFLGVLIIARSTRRGKRRYNDFNTLQLTPISFRNRASTGAGFFILKIIVFTAILLSCLIIPAGPGRF